VLPTSNGEHNRRGEAVSEFMPWLSAYAGKSKQIVAASIFYASPEPCLLDGLLDHRFMHNNSVCPYFSEFQAQGLCTSTGVVEAGCKVAIGTRLKRAGMHWTVRGANAIIALRCAKLSGRFEDFWERWSAAAAAAAG
jgi:hypothetical protein